MLQSPAQPHLFCTQNRSQTDKRCQQVTIEINTDPPPLDLPGDPKSMKLSGSMSVDELADAVKMMSYDFTLSPELME